MNHAIMFRNQRVEIWPARTFDVGRAKPNLFIYGIRHGNNWMRPLTVERHVVVNHWGDLVSKNPLPFKPDQDAIKLTRAEIRAFMDVDRGAYPVTPWR